MSSIDKKVYLVTGANSGLGLEASKQLASMDDTEVVYVAARTEAKAVEAIDGLVQKYNIPRSKLAFFPFDASNSKDAINNKVVSALPVGSKIDGLIFNAGGMGNDPTGKPVGPNHVLDIVQINLLGHVHLLDALMKNNFLRPNITSIVYSGSEGARGVPSFGMPAPKLPDTVQGYKDAMDGTIYSSKKKYSSMDAYPLTKGVAALYWSAFARKHPEYYVLTVSPGATMGTNVASHKSLPAPMRKMFPIMMKVFSLMGGSHGTLTGAKRYVDAVRHKNGYDKFTSGTFVASKKGASGSVCDQSQLKSGAPFGDRTKQDAAFEAVRAFAQ